LPAGGRSAPLPDVLQAVAQRFQVTVRQHNGIVKMRHWLWPDRDEEEAPAPNPEPWIIEAKRRVGLPLEALAAISRLTRPQQSALAAYSEPSLVLRPAVNYVRRNRPFVDAIALLSVAEVNAARQPTGLQLRRLDLRVRNTILQETLRLQPIGEPLGQLPAGAALGTLLIRTTPMPFNPKMLDHSVELRMPDGRAFWRKQLLPTLVTPTPLTQPDGRPNAAR
jgi:hypothetical protein